MALNLSKKFLVAMGFATLSMITTLIAYASPHWVDSHASSGNPFLNAGIWEICWNDYTFPLDLIGRRFIGCFWVLGRDLYEFRDNILNAWFMGVIVMFTMQLATQVILSCVVLISWLKLFPRALQYGIHYGTAVGFCISAGLSFIGLVVFGVKKESRSWMYRPDQNFLSWCYGLGACTMIFSVVCAAIFYKIAVEADEERRKTLISRAYYAPR